MKKLAYIVWRIAYSSKKAFILFFLLLTVTCTLFTVPLAHAQDGIGCVDGKLPTDLGEIPCTPAGFGSALYGVGLSFIGVVALLFIVYGGYLILTSQGNTEQIGRGKSYINYAIIGIVLAVAGYAVYQIIAVDIIKVPGFGS